MEEALELTLVRHPALDALGNRRLVLRHAVAVAGAVPEGSHRAHAAVLLVDPPFVEDLAPGGLLEAGEEVPDHDRRGSGRYRLYDVARILDPAVRDHGHARLGRLVRAAEHGGELRHADSGDDARRADRARAHADLDRVGAGFDQPLRAFGGGHVAAYHRHAREGALHASHRFDHVARIAVRRVEHHEIDPSRLEQGHAGVAVLRRHGRAYDEAAGLVGRGAREALVLLHVLHGDQPREPALAVHDRQLLDPVLVELGARAGGRGVRPLDDHARSHRVAHEREVVAPEPEVASRDDAHELAAAVDHRQTRHSLRLHEGADLPQGPVGLDGDGVLDDPVQVALDRGDLLGLLGRREVPVDDARAALQRDGHRHPLLGDGVHRRREDRHVERYVPRDDGGDVRVPREDIGVSGNEEHIVV